MRWRDTPRSYGHVKRLFRQCKPRMIDGDARSCHIVRRLVQAQIDVFTTAVFTRNKM